MVGAEIEMTPVVEPAAKVTVAMDTPLRFKVQT